MRSWFSRLMVLIAIAVGVVVGASPTSANEQPAPTHGAAAINVGFDFWW